MPRDYDIPVLDEDPRKILGVSAEADKEEIRAAYLKKIKELDSSFTIHQSEHDACYGSIKLAKKYLEKSKQK